MGGHCGFCGCSVRRDKDVCPAHADLREPWELHGPKPSPPRRLIEADRRPLAYTDDDGLIVVIAAWCDECGVMVTPNDDDCCQACGQSVLEEVKIHDLRFR
jgi:hypothetical protein